MDKLKAWWDSVQAFLDIDGDVWLGFFTAFILIRILAVLSHHAPLTAAEAATYSAAVGAFAYSNKGPKGS